MIVLVASSPTHQLILPSVNCDVTKTIIVNFVVKLKPTRLSNIIMSSCSLGYFCSIKYNYLVRIFYEWTNFIQSQDNEWKNLREKVTIVYNRRFTIYKVIIDVDKKIIHICNIKQTDAFPYCR